jgi:recombination protein RecA
VVVNKRNEVLNSVLGNIERCYGRGSIQKLGEAPKMNVETFSSGSVTLDHALGGGYPRGRVIEIYGPESSGKTTLALHAIAELQRLNGAACHTVIRIFESGLTCKYFSAGTAAFIDAEHALDPVYARHLGVNIDDLLVSQPDSGEMALDVVDQLVRSSAVDVVVVDSVAALVPRVELEGSPLKHFSTTSACNNECFVDRRYDGSTNGSAGEAHEQGSAETNGFTVEVSNHRYFLKSASKQDRLAM